MTISETQIAKDLLAYLRDHPSACADVSAQGYYRPWVRYRDGQYQLAGFGEIDRIHATTLSEKQALELFKNNPVQLLPAHKAYRWKPANRTVWEHAAEQDAFTSLTRCFWCGFSERTTDLSLYETVDDGNCWICSDCHRTWDNQNELVRELDPTQIPGAEISRN